MSDSSTRRRRVVHVVLVVGAVLSAALAAAVAVERALIWRQEVRVLAAEFLGCPVGEVGIGVSYGTDTVDDWDVEGCGRRGQVSCSGHMECAFYYPAGDGYENVGHVPERPPAPLAVPAR